MKLRCNTFAGNVLTAFQEIFEIDLRGLAVLRIGLGILLLCRLIERTFHFQAFQAGDGFYPLDLARDANPVWSSLHLLSGNLEYQILLHCIASAAALMLAVGYRTFLATALSWFLQISWQRRNDFAIDVGDDALVLLLFWSMFLPLGRRFSIDSKGGPSEQAAESVCSVASAGLLLQPAWIYFFSSLAKMKTWSWRSGNAVSVVLSDDIWSNSLGRLVFESYSLSKGLTYLTLGIEFIAPLLLFVPFHGNRPRCLAIAILICLQVGLGCCIQLSWIPVTMTLAMIPFLPSSVWDAVFRGSAQPHTTPPLQTLRAPAWNNLVASAVLVYVFLANVDIILGRRFRLPGTAHRVARLVELRQGWGMYAPPDGGSFRLILQMHLESDKRFRLLVGPESDAWPDTDNWEQLEMFWNDYRAKMFLYSNGDLKSRERVLKAYLVWVARQWDAAHPTDEVIAISLVREVRDKNSSTSVRTLESIELDRD